MKLLTISVFLCIVSIINSFPTSKETDKTDPDVEMDKNVDMVKSVDCQSLPGSTRPIDIYNSAYYLLPDQRICCPFQAQYTNGEFVCINSTKVEQKCKKEGKGTTSEPCGFCETCAKLACETCEGLQLIHGNCDSGLKCSGGNKTSPGTCVAVAQNGPLVKEVAETCRGKLNCLGVCQNGVARCEEQDNGEPWRCVMYAKTRNFNETCGGAYGKVGRCKDEGLKCTADEDDFLKGANITGRCFREKQKICFKNCSMQPHGTGHYVCGSDGVWYLNNCFRKQQNCDVPELDNTRPDWVLKIDDPAEILKVCGEEPTDPPTPASVPAEANEDEATEEAIEAEENSDEKEEEDQEESTPTS